MLKCLQAQGLPYRTRNFTLKTTHFKNCELEGIKQRVNSFLALLIHLGSHSETFMVLILYRFPYVSWRESPNGYYYFTSHYWIGLCFSQYAESIQQIPSLVDELCKAILYLVNSTQDFFVLEFLSIISSALVTQAVFRYTRPSLVWSYSACKTRQQIHQPLPTGNRRLCFLNLPHIHVGLAAHQQLVTSSFAQRKAEHRAHAPPFSSAIVSLLAFHASPICINGLIPKDTRRVMTPVPQ